MTAKRMKPTELCLQNIELMRATLAAYDACVAADDEAGCHEIEQAAGRAALKPLQVLRKHRTERARVPEVVDKLARHFAGNIGSGSAEQIQLAATCSLQRLATDCGVGEYLRDAAEGGEAWEATAQKLLSQATADEAHVESGRRGQPRGGGPRNRAMVIVAKVLGCSAEHVEDVMRDAGARVKSYEGPNQKKIEATIEYGKQARRLKAVQERHQGVILAAARRAGEIEFVDLNAK